METAWRNIGKKSLFGKDKGAEAFSKFIVTFRSYILALHEDGLVKADDAWPAVESQIKSNLERFALAYPNWPDAYRFAGGFFTEDSRGTQAAVLADAREWIEYLNGAKITRSLN